MWIRPEPQLRRRSLKLNRRKENSQTIIQRQLNSRNPPPAAKTIVNAADHETMIVMVSRFVIIRQFVDSFQCQPVVVEEYKIIDRPSISPLRSVFPQHFSTHRRRPTIKTQFKGKITRSWKIIKSYIHMRDLLRSSSMTFHLQKRIMQRRCRQSDRSCDHVG